MSSSCGCPTSRFTSLGPSLSFNLEEQHLGQGVQLQQADPHLESSVLTSPMSLVPSPDQVHTHSERSA